ncbi:uncharacterized protein Bfra_000807 [Botrytis fragariae]|uniref:Uncharacterized protein n=1 Tax=Botrytis fragariae TaxID=1964551 RepID=A0A8H6ENQ6_9HELO|nr:uncharacterized protein Bfra_000807 [Botrytis fragariae]KAF5878640.1 hypothetical protein Bfra_000807 [Botrytis fragariae]
MSNKNLQVKLVFWQSDQHRTPITDTSPATLRNSIIRLWTPRIQSWIFEGFALILDSVNGHLQICLTIRHMELGTNDEGVENAISALCQYIFLDSSVTALDTILTNNNLIMGPFSETTMTATDRIFGRSYSFENLKQLGGFEALMQKAAQRPGPGILRNPTKWIHAPLYAGLCVTHLLTFLDYPLEMFTDHVNTQAESDDEQDQELLNIVRHIANFARVLTSMAPKARGQIEKQLAMLDSTKKKALLKEKAMNLGSGVMLLEEIVGRLAGDSGGRNPDVLETRQLCSIVTRMMCANESLHDAALIYHDSCVADKTKNAAFTVGSLGVLAVSGGLLAFPPAGAAVALVSFTGFCGSLISTGIFAQNTVVSGKALHRSRNLKPVMRRIYLSLTSCRLFLLLILSRVLPCLDRGSDQYQQFRSMFGTKLDIEMDLLDKPGYLFDNVELMVNHITDAFGQLQHEIIQ